MAKIKGKFFLPENYKKKKTHIDGILEIHDNGLIHLDLSGSLIVDKINRLLSFNNQQKVNIWGIVENGSKISLLDSINIKTTQHLGEKGMNLELYRIQFVLKNSWIEDIYVKKFNRISASIEGLAQWLNIFGGKESISFDKEGKTEIFSFGYRVPECINFKIYDNLSACFYFTCQHPFKHYRYELNQKTCLELSSSEQESIFYFLEKLHHFTRFLNIVSDSVLGTEFIVMTSFKDYFTTSNGIAYNDLNLIRGIENYSDQNLNSEHHLFLVKYDAIKENFEQIIKSWFGLNTDSIRRVIDILYECIENKNKVRIYLFLAISQGVEGFYRIAHNQRHHNFDKMIRITLEENMKSLKLHSQNKINQDVEVLATSIKKLRNALTHLGKFELEEIKQTEIYQLTNLLKNALSINLLKYIGIDESLISISQ